MTGREVTNVAASVRRRLLNRARAEGRAFQELATLYAMERFLFRLGSSVHAERFVLKGGLMTLLWAGDYGRVTRDIDLLGRGASSVDAVVMRVAEVLGVDVPDDGVLFDTSSIRGAQITVDAAYVGVRLLFSGDLGGMVLRMQVDVGFGDSVVPPPTWVDYPQLLDHGSPRLLGYPPEATLAEKLHAICFHGLANSRLKDYYDLWTGHRLAICTAEGLGEALWHTFERRGNALPTEVPVGLTDAFAAEAARQVQWAAFIGKSQLDVPALAEVVREVAAFAAPAFAEARRRG